MVTSEVKDNKEEESVSVPMLLTSMEDEEKANFETAITETSFGKFNVLLMVITVLPTFAQVVETGAMSYVVPIAQCDLSLTLEDKGMLNAVAFAGMISSSFFWGYLCDTLGRKKIIVTGYFLVGFFVLMASLSHNITILIISKFFGGFIINGPFSAATTYLSEFHSSKFRAIVQMVRGTVVNLAITILPLVAWGILPRNLTFTIFGSIRLHSWNIFLFVCSLVPFASGIAYIFMPESPKFLMSRGKNEKALKVFQKVYIVNTGKTVDTYPIKALLEEIKKNDEKRNAEPKETRNQLTSVLRKWWNQMKPLFLPPYIRNMALVCSCMFLIMMSANTLNLWLPQIFQEINDYQFTHNGSSSNICEMLGHLKSQNKSGSTTCEVNLENNSVYSNTILVGIARMIGSALAGTIINRLGKKTLLVSTSAIAGIFACSIYFAQNAYTVLALASLQLTFAGVGHNILVAVALELFPTTLRTLALSMHLMCGRISTVIGNLIFPSLLYAGCSPPFMFLGSLMFVSAVLSLFYPNTENKPLE